MSTRLTPGLPAVWLAAAVVASYSSDIAHAQSVACRELAALTGAHTRVVWVQDQSAANIDTLALGRELKLMGLDSQDGRGERPILNDVQNYAKPLLTPDGKRVVYSDRFSKDVFVVNWDGTGKRRLGAGFAVEVWADPESGETWVYACTQVGKHNSINFKALKRMPLDGPARWEPVWDKSEISPDNFQLSADGKFAAGEFPWPHGGTADLVKRTTRKRADGCWASLAPDNSGLCWVFDGPHRNVYFYPRESAAGWKVSLNTAPGIGGHEVFHPRWSNHVRHFAMTGPYKVKTNTNVIGGGGPEVEVYVGRFSEDYRQVEGWAQVTHNTRGDFHPDAWIAGGEKSEIAADVFKLAPAETTVADRWPGSTAGLVFLWDNAADENMIAGAEGAEPKACRVEARGKARYNRYFDLDCTGGSFVAERAGADLLEACKKTNALTIEAAVTSLRADQSGPARIVACSSNPNARNFLLMQDHESLVFEINLKPGGMATAKLGKVAPGKLQHVIVTYAAGTLACFLDGQPVPLSAKVQGDFGGWAGQQLVFGDEFTGKYNWSGRLEGISIYNRALMADEASRHYELFSARLDNRLPAERLRIRAKCLEVSQIPDPRTIVPYRRALIVNRYRVEKVLQGEFDGRELLVAQWGILDKAVVADAKFRAGQTIELTLESFDDHPELQSERQIVDVESLDLPWFYAVGK
ncbi:MAG: LamG domain-containing protein [Planctomycetia bacterium]|nr:LamG domain-containing protein [Planctomycetia bacterium]